MKLINLRRDWSRKKSRLISSNKNYKIKLSIYRSRLEVMGERKLRRGLVIMIWRGS